MIKRLVLTFFVFLFVFPAQASELHKITFCRPNNMVSALAYIADTQGYFRDEGLDVTFVTTSNAKLCVDELIAGKSDVLAGADGPASYGGFSNHPLKMIAQTSFNPGTSLFARRDKGIAKESDIKGKTIGYLPGTASYLYLARLLDKTDLSFSDIHTVALQPPAMSQALQGGVIDGFVMWEPWGEQALKVLGDKAVRLSDKALYSHRATIVIGKDFSDRPEDVRSVLKALLKAEAYVCNNPKDSISFLADAVKLDSGLLEKYWGDYEFEVRFDNSLVALMEDNARLIIRDDPNFKDKPVPDYRRTIDASFLRAVAPNRVEEGM